MYCKCSLTWTAQCNHTLTLQQQLEYSAILLDNEGLLQLALLLIWQWLALPMCVACICCCLLLPDACATLSSFSVRCSARTAKKSYVAITTGAPTQVNFHVDAPIDRHPAQK